MTVRGFTLYVDDTFQAKPVDDMMRLQQHEKLLLLASTCLLFTTIEAGAASSTFPAPPFKSHPSAEPPPFKKAPPPKKSLDPSLEDLESGLRRARDAVSGLAGAMRGIFLRNRHIVLAAGGLLGLAHGGTAAFTILFIQSFGASGWPLMQNGLRRAAMAYEDAKASTVARDSDEYASEIAPLRTELVNLAAHLAYLRRERASEEAQRAVIRQMRTIRRKLEAVPPSRRAAPVLVAACEPAVVRDVLLGIWSGVTVSLTAACSSAARTIGIGVSLGEVVAKMATSMLSKVEPAFRRMISALPAEAVMLSYLGPSLFGTAALNLAGRSLGCWVAYRLQHLAAVLSVSLLSARMVLEAVVPTLEEQLSSDRVAEAELRAKEAAEVAAKATAYAEAEGEAEAAEQRFRSRKGGGGESLEAKRRRRARQRRRRSVSRELMKLSSQPSDAPRPFAFLHSAGPRREATAWMLAVISLQSQRSRGFRLPLYLKVPLLPIIGVEALLQKLANRLTAAGYPGRMGGGPRGGGRNGNAPSSSENTRRAQGDVPAVPGWPRPPGAA